MYILYLDEFGHAGVYDPTDPNRRHSPIFGLAGVLVRGDKWRALDRGYLDLKREFFKNEIQSTGVRPERWEFKGTGLSTPAKQSNRRNQRFAFKVLDLLNRLDCTIVGKGKVKRQGPQIDSDALYTSIVQGLMKTLEKSLKALSGVKEGMGLMVIDRRGESWDKQVIASAQSYMFSTLNAQGFPMFNRIVESPLVVDSEYYHGVQVADIVCGLLGGVFRWRKCPDVSQKYQTIDSRYGTIIDALTRNIDHQHSLWVD